MIGSRPTGDPPGTRGARERSGWLRRARPLPRLDAPQRQVRRDQHVGRGHPTPRGRSWGRRGSPATLTQAVPAPATRAWGVPTVTRAVTAFVRSSTRVTAPVEVVARPTPLPSTKLTKESAGADIDRCRRGRAPGSSRHSRPSSGEVTHDGAAADGDPREPGALDRERSAMRFEAGSMRGTTAWSRRRTRRPRRPRRWSARRCATGIRRRPGRSPGRSGRSGGQGRSPRRQPAPTASADSLRSGSALDARACAKLRRVGDLQRARIDA